MAQPAAAQPATEYEDLPIDEVGEDETNYRKTYPPAEMKELTESIRAQGVVQPVVVRPWPNKGPKDPKYQIVIGTRRRRCSLAAGRKTIPAVIRADLDDRKVREVRLVENLIRHNPSALDEADGFRELHEVFKLTVPEIAAKVSKDKSYVYGRMTLCRLCDDGREALESGALDVSVMMLVARIPKKEVQQATVTEFLTWIKNRGSLRYKEAEKYVHEHCMLRLAGAPFDTTDEKLVPAAGSCAKCPKRTGNVRELFPDVKSVDTCTDPPCYREKVDATWRALAAGAEKKGTRIIDEKETDKLFPHSDRLSHAAPYVDLDEPCYEDAKSRPYRKLVPKDAQIFLARDQSGNIHQLVAKAELPGLMKKAGVKGGALASAKQAADATDFGKANARQQREEAERRAKQEQRRRTITAGIAEAVGKATGGDEYYRLLLRVLERQGFHDAVSDVVKRRGWVVKGKQNSPVFLAQVDALTGDELPRLVLELVITRSAYFTFQTAMPDGVAWAAKLYQIDLRKIEKRVAAELAEKKATKKARAKKGAAK